MISRAAIYRIARAGWYLLALISVAITLLSIPAYPVPYEFGPLENIDASPAFLQFMDAARTAGSLGLAAFCLGLAALLFLRNRTDPMSLFASYYLLLYGTLVAGPVETIAAQGEGTRMYAVIAMSVILGPLTIALFSVFPDGRFVPSWTRWLIPIAVVGAVASAVYTDEAFETFFFTNPLLLLYGLAWVGTLLGVLYGQVVRYRKFSGTVERQQTKWVIFGLGIQSALLLVSSVPYNIALSLPEGVRIPWWAPPATLVWFLMVAVFPVSLSVALTRYRLWDIDIYINRALVYGVLTLTLATVYVGGVALLQSVLRTVTGRGDALAIVATTLAIAALFNPLRVRIQGAIDRRFYRSRYDSAKALAEFSGRVQEQVNLENLSRTLLEVVDESVQPAHLSIWLRGSRTPRTG